MINTGLVLRRPFESDYSAMRRFVIANRNRNLQELRREFAKNHLDIDNGKQLSLPESAQAWEKLYCESHGIDYVRPLDMPTNCELRNCPECARIGYHSVIYQYPWVQNCPIHGCRLLTNCPQCRSPWPPLSSLQANACACCGVREFQLFESQNSELNGFIETRFGSISSLIAQYQASVSSTCLFARDAHYRQFRVHSSPDEWHPDWPSLYAYNDAGKRQIFQQFGVSLFPVCERAYPIGKVPTDITRFKMRHYLQQRFVRRQFRAFVRERLRLLLDVDVTEDRFRVIFLQPVNFRDVVKMSEDTWDTYVHYGGFERRPLPYTDGCQFFRGARDYTLRPSSPCFMIHVTDEPVTESHFRGTPSNSFHRSVPRDLQVWLYKCDLWWSLISMLYFFDSVARTVNNRWCMDEFEKDLKETAVPTTWYRPRYMILEADPNEISVRVPARIANATFDGVYLTSQAEL